MVKIIKYVTLLICSNKVLRSCNLGTNKIHNPISNRENVTIPNISDIICCFDLDVEPNDRLTSKNIRWVAVVDISQVSYGTP